MDLDAVKKMLSSRVLDLVRNDITELTDDEILGNALDYATDFVYKILGETTSGLAKQVILLMIEFILYHRYGYLDTASKVFEQVKDMLEFGGNIYISSEEPSFTEEELERWD